MVQISLTNKGIFILVVLGVTFLLFLLSDRGRTGYETNPDIISMRSVFVATLVAIEEAGGAVKAIHDFQPQNALNLHKKPKLLQLGRAGHSTKAEVVTDADLVSNYVIIRRIKHLRADFDVCCQCFEFFPISFDIFRHTMILM